MPGRQAEQGRETRDAGRRVTGRGIRVSGSEHSCCRVATGVVVSSKGCNRNEIEEGTHLQVETGRGQEAEPRRIFFDLDGTLTDPAPGIVACMVHALDALGHASPSLNAMRRFIGPPLREAFGEMLGSDDPALQEEAVRLYRERFSTVGLFENAVYPGIPEALAELLQHGFALRVVTSKPTVYADRIIDHFELRSFFPVVYGSELSGERSNKAELLSHVLHSEGVAASRACMVGDRSHDVVGARAHGIPAVGVLWGYGAQDELHEAGAARVVPVVEELVAVLRGVWASPACGARIPR